MPEQAYKWCEECGETKLATEFWKDATTGRKPLCKPCASAKEKARRTRLA